MKTLLLSLAALLVGGSPVTNDQSCGAREWYNPRTNACQSYALQSSCGLLGKQCPDGTFCTNDDGWAQNSMGTSYN
jgi:hypothetical protein